MRMGHRTIIALMLIVLCAGCGGGTTVATVPYRNDLAYQATFATIDQPIPMTYTFQFVEEQRPDVTITVRTNGIVTTTLPLSNTVGPIAPGVDYTFPVTFTLSAQGEGTILVMYEPWPGIYLKEQVFVLATDEGVFLDSLSRAGVYGWYLSELQRRGSQDEATTQQRRNQISHQRSLIVPINGTPTTLNFSLPDLFTRP